MLHNFLIGTQNFSPDVERPQERKMQECAREGAPIPYGETHTYHCRVEGRYVAILQNGNRQYLSLCEVEVFGGKSCSVYLKLYISS